MNATKLHSNGLGKGDYLEVWPGSMEINNSSASIYIDKGVTAILLGEPFGDAETFEKVSIRCECGIGDCRTYLDVYSNGEIAIELDNSMVYATKIDPRYCSAIYRHVAAIEANEPA